jgi:membrane-associated protease RseP (regulator of RpoE activity)
MSIGDERLAPVSDQVLRPDDVAEDRRGAASRLRIDVLETPGVPMETWRRVGEELARRGVPSDTRTIIVDRARAEARDDATVDEARAAIDAAAAGILEDTGRVGDLRHRVLRGDEGRFFHDRPAWQRAIVLASGSFMHFVQAIVLLFAGFLLFGQTVPLPTVDEVLPDSPAAEAGLQPGDRIVAVEGVAVEDFETAREFIRGSAGEPLTFRVVRDGRSITVVATPEASEVDGETVGLLGFVPEAEDRPLAPGDALYETFAGDTGVVRLSRETFVALGRVFGPDGLGQLFTQVTGEQERSIEGAASPIGLARAAGEGSAEYGPLFLLLILASINVFVGIFNLVPLPPLDGGHLAVLGIESVVNAARRVRGGVPDFKLDPRAIAAVAVPVIVVLGTVFLAVVWLDIVRPIQLP